jgi:hypothetical protein
MLLMKPTNEWRRKWLIGWIESGLPIRLDHTEVRPNDSLANLPVEVTWQHGRSYSIALARRRSDREFPVRNFARISL